MSEVKINDRNIEQLGIILRAVDLLWLAAQDIDLEDEKMSGKVESMTRELVEDVGLSLSQNSFVSDMQNVSDHIRDEVYAILKEAGYAEDDEGCTHAEYDAARFITWRHQTMVDEMEGWEKEKPKKEPHENTSKIKEDKYNAE
jgi:hypothetical protein